MPIDFPGPSPGANVEPIAGFRIAIAEVTDGTIICRRLRCAKSSLCRPGGRASSAHFLLWPPVAPAEWPPNVRALVCAGYRDQYHGRFGAGARNDGQCAPLRDYGRGGSDGILACPACALGRP